MVASSLFKLAGRIASRMADRSVDSGLPRIEKLFGTPPRTPFPTTVEKIAFGDEAFARGPYEFGGPPKKYTGPIEEVDEVILDAPLSRSERDYFAGLSREQRPGIGHNRPPVEEVIDTEDILKRTRKFYPEARIEEGTLQYNTHNYWDKNLEYNALRKSPKETSTHADLAYQLEAAGDNLRELTKGRPEHPISGNKGYIVEKINRLERSAKNRHPDDAFGNREKLSKDDKIKLDKIREDASKIPVYSEETKLAKAIIMNVIENRPDSLLKNIKKYRDIMGLPDIVEPFKHGGGLSSINKPITINGQEHNLAWIRPDEASALKAMGGSGKKVGGIPAYFDAWSMGETPTPEEVYSVPEPETAADVEQFMETYEQPTAKDYADLPEAYTYKADIEKRDQDDFWNRPSDDPTEYQKIYDRPELDIYKTKLIERLGVPGMESYMKGLGTSGLRQMVDKFHTGYDFGGPMGTMEGLTRNIALDYASKLGLKKLSKELKELKERKLSDEELEKEKENILSRYQGIADDLGGKFIPQKEFKGMYGDFDKTLEKSGLKGTLAGTALDFFKPGSLLDKGISAGLNALTKAFGVVGEFTTPEGKTFRVMDDGTLVEPDMPPDPSSVDEGTVEVDKTVEAVVAPTSETVAEVEAGPMETFQAGLESIESNEGIKNSIQILMDQYGISEGEARVMLGLDVNIA